MDCATSATRCVWHRLVSDSFIETIMIVIPRHVELTNGTVMPFSRGASFYKVNDEGRICKARDLVEALPKVGQLAVGTMTSHLYLWP